MLDVSRMFDVSHYVNTMLGAERRASARAEGFASRRRGDRSDASEANCRAGRNAKRQRIVKAKRPIEMRG
jgi:hypothetical protein